MAALKCVRTSFRRNNEKTHNRDSYTSELCATQYTSAFDRSLIQSIFVLYIILQVYLQRSKFNSRDSFYQYFFPSDREKNKPTVCILKKKKNPHTLKLLHHFRFHSLIYQQNASIFKPDAFVQCQSFICLLIYITHTNRKKETKRLTLISRFERAVVVFFVGVLLLFTFI